MRIRARLVHAAAKPKPIVVKVARQQIYDNPGHIPSEKESTKSFWVRMKYGEGTYGIQVKGISDPTKSIMKLRLGRDKGWYIDRYGPRSVKYLVLDDLKKSQLEKNMVEFQKWNEERKAKMGL